ENRNTKQARKRNKKGKRKTRGLPFASSLGWALLGLNSLGGLFLFLALVPVVLALELFHAAGSVHVFHLAGEKRVARRADFNVDVLLGAARDKLVAATARHHGLFVFRVDVFFHGTLDVTEG